MENLFLGHLVALVGLIVSAVLLHVFIVVRKLRSRGYGPLTGWIPFNHYRELADYRKICEEEGAPLAWWRALVVIDVFIVVGILGSIFLGLLQP